MELVTARLRMRPFHDDDVRAFARFALLDDYRRYLGSDHPDPSTFVANNVGIDGSWVIEFEGRVIGSVFLGDELACLLDPAVHQLGIGSEAAAAVIDDGFTRREYPSITAHADPANRASVRALDRFGFEHDADGSYVLTRDRWNAR